MAFDFGKVKPAKKDDRTTDPVDIFQKNKGKITDGVICQYEDVIYLIPISTIIARRSGSSDDIDDDDDESSPIDVEVEEDSE